MTGPAEGSPGYWDAMHARLFPPAARPGRIGQHQAGRTPSTLTLQQRRAIALGCELKRVNDWRAQVAAEYAAAFRTAAAWPLWTLHNLASLDEYRRSLRSLLGCQLELTGGYRHG